MVNNSSVLGNSWNLNPSAIERLFEVSCNNYMKHRHTPWQNAEIPKGIPGDM